MNGQQCKPLGVQNTPAANQFQPGHRRHPPPPPPRHHNRETHKNSVRTMALICQCTKAKNTKTKPTMIINKDEHPRLSPPHVRVYENQQPDHGVQAKDKSILVNSTFWLGPRGSAVDVWSCWPLCEPKVYVFLY